MGAVYHRVLLLFADGLGLAPATPDNPLATVETPTLSGLLGGPLTVEGVAGLGGKASPVGPGPRPGRVGPAPPGGTTGRDPAPDRGPLVALHALDATLGIPGLPQSATGQATLFTGVNAAAALGRHVPALPGPRLRRLITESSLFSALRRRGRHVTFANAFTDAYLELLAQGKARPSATTWAVLAADVELRLLKELARNQAVTFDVCRDLFARRLGLPLAPVTATEAGAHLAAIAGAHDLTLYETFLPDLAGHRRWGISAREAIERLDGLLAGLFAARPKGLSVVLTSDHGNLEEAGHRRHTRNPVPLLVVGPLAGRFHGVGSLEQVAPRIVELLTRPATSD